MGSETFDTNIENFLNKTSDQVCNVKAKLSEEINKNNQLIELFQQDDSIYYVEQQENPSATTIPNDSLQKTGYLNLRSKFPLFFNWERAFYFLQNGWLMCQPRTEIVGSSFLELKSDLTVSATEIDDRLFTFQIVSQFPKRIIYFQANSQRDMQEWILTLQNAINDDNRAKLLNYQSKNNNKNISSSYLLEPNVNFELKDSLLSKNKATTIVMKPQQGDSFKVRFLGSMNVKADKGNEYIHETIRSVMAARAKHNIFKLNEFNLIVNSESLSLFDISTNGNEASSDDLLKAKFNLSDLAFWSTHHDNQRLFGFIIKETSQSLKFLCLCFESDLDSNKICESIEKATKLAYQLLIDDENKAEHFKKMKQTEKEILLHNIKSLPDSEEGEEEEEEDSDLSGTSETNENGSHLYTIVKKSPNPNFVILDRDILENYKINLNPTTSNDQQESNETEKNSLDNKTTETDA